MELNQKLTKHSQKTLNTLNVGTWGLKRREGICSKGAYFRELKVQLTTHKFVCFHFPHIVLIIVIHTINQPTRIHLM